MNEVQSNLRPVIPAEAGIQSCHEAGYSRARGAIHPLREVEHVLGRLRQNNVAVTGFVLNNLMPRSAAYGYRKYGYAYSYKYSKQ